MLTDFILYGKDCKMLAFFIGVFIDTKKVIKNVCLLIEIRNAFPITRNVNITGIFLL